jgi:hypothetical protein
LTPRTDFETQEAYEEVIDASNKTRHTMHDDSDTENSTEQRADEMSREERIETGEEVSGEDDDEGAADRAGARFSKRFGVSLMVSGRATAPASSSSWRPSTPRTRPTSRTFASAPRRSATTGWR